MEQTMNSDAGRTFNGFTFLLNSISGQQRWCFNHGIHCTLIAAILDDCGLQQKQDVTNDLKKYRIKQFQEQLDCFLRHLKTRMNPFSVDVPRDSLFQIATGESAPKQVEQFSLNIEANGEALRKKMIDSCTMQELSIYSK